LRRLADAITECPRDNEARYAEKHVDAGPQTYGRVRQPIVPPEKVMGVPHYNDQHGKTAKCFNLLIARGCG
jgi:hypothetical protein